MGLKKYEIITVGSDKRVRALRSWQVGDRYVNIGDVGGIVYDEKTLSQDGACWLFRGNFGFPGARIGGDSIVDVGEATLSATGAPNVDILGSSVVVGSKLLFESDQTAANAVVLTAADFEQGGFGYSNPRGTDWERWKVNSPNYVRTVKPIFAGGAPKTLKLDVPGYKLNWFALDRDSNVIAYGGDIISGEGITTVVPACHSFVFRLTKDPIAAIVPADATAAQITFTGTYETKLSIIDSRVEINPATSTGTTTIRPGGTYTITPGAKYPDSVIQNSKVSMMVSATANRTITLMAEFINTSAVIDASVEIAPAPIGIYKNVKNLAFSGSITGDAGVGSRGVIQATDCDNFAVSSTIFPGLASAQTANMPFIFQGCNVPDGRFYHHAQIANTYKNIDFSLAQADLGKTIVNPNILVSSGVEGMYRLYSVGSSVFGALVESYESVRSVSLLSPADSYGTMIYADAYLKGSLNFRGTNVFGNSVKHYAGNTQDISGMLIKGLYNATTNGTTISGVVASNARAVVLRPFRISGSGCVSVDAPAGVECNIYLTDAKNKILSNTGYVPGVNAPVSLALTAVYAYVSVKKTDGSDILSLDEVKGVTVTTYNGCLIINTKATAAVIVGNVRVEDNATLIDVSVTGTGYFGGNSVIQAPSALVGQLPIEGAAYMSDNAVFAPSEANASAVLSLLDMRDNAVFAGRLGGAVKYNITMADNARFLGITASLLKFIMRGNSFVAAAGTVASACSGLLTMKDDVRIENGDIITVGYITLRGKYKQTASKTWTGKRVIASQDAPTYDDNVKTKYDF